MGTQIKSDGGCFQKYIGGGGYCYKKYGGGYLVCDTECKGSPPPFVVVLGGWVCYQDDN